jgi:peptide deformylase
MTLLHKSDPLMRKTMPFFDFDNPPIDPIELKNEMIDRMFEEGGVGLAANQIGYEYRAFVMKGANKEQSMFLVNPEIIEFSKETVVMEEGCLTGGCEGIFANITRPEKIVARWQDELGEIRELDFSGMTSRCFQHELDHLNGILFIDHMSRIKYERAVKKKQKREKQYGRIREQMLSVAREYRSKNPQLPNERAMSETDKVSSS